MQRSSKTGVDFFIDKFWDKKNDRLGMGNRPEGKCPGIMGKLVYGQTFAIYALAEYYMATGDERGIEYAEKTFDALKKYAADTFYGGYFENFKEDWTLESAGVYGGDLKSLDIHMHTMEAYTTLYEATHKEVHKRALQEIIDIVLKHMVDYDSGVEEISLVLILHQSRLFPFAEPGIMTEIRKVLTKIH